MLPQLDIEWCGIQPLLVHCWDSIECYQCVQPCGLQSSGKYQVLPSLTSPPNPPMRLSEVRKTRRNEFIGL